MTDTVNETTVANEAAPVMPRLNEPAPEFTFIAFAKRADDFRAIDTELLGLSIDSNYSHIAWVRNIKEKFGIDIPFPVIADLKMDVAKKYGMVHPGADDTHALRLVKALQTTDKYKVATPEGWQPGDPVIVPPPATVDEAEKRLGMKDAEVKDWYFVTRKAAV